MPARNPRLHLVVERKVYEAVAALARREGLSLSVTARDLLREALELHEDAVLGAVAEARRRGLGRRRLLTHDDMLKRFGIS